MTGTLRVDLPMARRLLCWYGVFALLAPRLPAPSCPFRRLIGRRCPACGLTAAVSAALHGRTRRASALHRLGPVTAAAVLVAGVMTLADALGDRVALRIPLRPVRPPSMIASSRT